MSYDRYSYWVLCEDRTQLHFVQGFLKAKGVNPRKIRSQAPLPEGRGDAAKYVFDRYQEARRAITGRTSRSILIVVSDVDASGRGDDDSEALARNMFNRLWADYTGGLRADEPVVVVLPCRNIETWFNFLDHQTDPDSAKETINRKNDYRNPKPATYGEMTAGGDFPDPDCLPYSLSRTLDEIRSKKAAFTC